MWTIKLLGRRQTKKSYMRVDSSDLKCCQIVEIDGDLAVSGSGRPAEWHVIWLYVREEAAGD